jgi:hypothetical protein
MHIPRKKSCLVIGRDFTFLLIIKMGRDLKSKTMAVEYVSSNISRNNVGTCKKGFTIILICN